MPGLQTVQERCSYKALFQQAAPQVVPLLLSVGVLDERSPHLEDLVHLRGDEGEIGAAEASEMIGQIAEIGGRSVGGRCELHEGGRACSSAARSGLPALSAVPGAPAGIVRL